MVLLTVKSGKLILKWQKWQIKVANKNFKVANKIKVAKRGKVKWQMK